MKPDRKSWLEKLLRWGFGLLLIYASWEKILDPLDFARAVENYRVIGHSLSIYTAAFLPMLEFLTGLLLLAGIWKDAASAVNACLMAVFLILVAQAATRGLDIECGCFGSDESQTIGPLKLAENILYALLSFVLWRLIRSRSAGWAGRL
ncbi:DoxX family membrane protein [bacterium]|nr:DoxX family membrane protein [bacterium]